MTAAAPAASSCCVRWEPMRLAPPVTTNRLPAMCMTVLRPVLSRPLPPLVGEDDGLRRCFAVEHPPPVLPSMDLEYAGGDGPHASDVVAMRAVAWWLLSRHWHVSPPLLPCSPPSDLSPLLLPLSHGIKRPHAYANRS